MMARTRKTMKRKEKRVAVVAAAMMEEAGKTAVNTIKETTMVVELDVVEEAVAITTRVEEVVAPSMIEDKVAVRGTQWIP